VRLVGGRFCLDFINSVDPRVGTPAQEYLSTPDDLARWAGRAAELHELHVPSDLHFNKSKFVEFKELREILYRIFELVAKKKTPASEDLIWLGDRYAQIQGKLQLVRCSSGFAWQPKRPDTDWLEWIIVEDAMRILTSASLDRVRICSSTTDCGWIFFDGSKNGSRRWCSMESCGAKHKMRDYYKRKKQSDER
jgi:predicted RNA-binding Zn ribbon-like protein